MRIPVNTVIFFIFFLAVSAGVSFAASGEVLAERLNVRSSPDKDSRCVMILKKGTVFTTKGHIDRNWLEIEKDGTRGFIRNRKTYIRVSGDTDNRKERKTEIQKNIANPTAEKKKVVKEIKQREEEVRAFSIKEKAVLGELDSIDRELNRSQLKMAGLKKNLAVIENDILENSRDEEKLKKAVKKNEKYVASRLTAIYRLGHLGKMNVIASADTMYSMIGRQRALAEILKEDERVLSDHMKNLKRLKEIEISLLEKRKETEQLENEIAVQLGVVEKNRKQRSVLLSEIRNKKSDGLTALTSLKESARVLDQMIRDLERDRLPQKKQEQKTTGRSEEPMVKTSFTAKKGQLLMPVKGQVVQFFGKCRSGDSHVETFQSGIVLKADRGEPIQAVGAGQVLYSDWLKGYGNLIIIDHGHGYYTVYGHTDEVFKRKGDQVEDREVIATVGDTGSLSGSVLHFEIRHRGKPLDPMNWLAKKSR